jgi:hypothetical protein
VGGLRARQQVEGEGRRHRQRHQERREDRDDVGHPQGREKPALDPRQGEQGKEHEDDHHRAEYDRRADLDAGLVDDRPGGLRVGGGVVLAQPAEDVLHINDRVVHQLAHGHGDAAQGHHVDRQLRPSQPTDRTENQAGHGQRQRDGGQRDEGGAEIQEEQEQDDYHQEGADRQCLADVGDAVVDEALGLEQLGVDDHVGGQRLARLGQCLRHLRRHRTRVGVGLLGDGQDDARAAVDAGVAAPRLRRLHDARDLPQQDVAVGGRLDGHLGQLPQYPPGPRPQA